MEQATQLRMCFTCCTEKPESEFGRSKPNTCKECIRVKARRRYQEDPAIRDRMRSASSARWHANREELAARARADQAERRAAAIRIYGGRCVRCGATDGLEFDHVNGDGRAHRRREGNNAMYRRIARTDAPLADVELQLLCRTHHYEKTGAERRARAGR